MLQRKDPVLYRFLEREYEKNEEIGRRLQERGTEAAKNRLTELLEERQRIESAMKEYENQRSD